MKLYLVRHGETSFNAQNIYQPEDSVLTKEGQEQAEFLARRFKTIPVDLIVSSPFLRAKQTAQAIADKLGKEIVYSELLQEIRRPSELVGKSMEHPEALRVRSLIDEHFEHRDWHYSDEENFEDFKGRVQQFLDSLSQRTEQNILCVTHGGTLRMIISLMLQGEKLSPEFFLRFYKFVRTKNTGITVCENDTGKWRLVTWNDHAHLGSA